MQIFMHRAAALIEYKMFLRYLLRHEMRQIPIRNKENIFIRQRFDHLYCICRCDTDIGIFL